MTAIQQLQAFYAADPEIGRMSEDIHNHLVSGYVYVTPANLALARPVSSKWSAKRLSDSSKTIGLTECADCWYVWAAIGDVDYLLSLIPYPLPFIAFARRKTGRAPSKIKFYQFNRFVHHGRIQTKSA